MDNKHYESLARLYLRLKGFLVSNLILHSEQQGNLKSELDIVAMRMPYHNQDYREVNVSDYLDCSNSRIEILIADVKNSHELNSVKFNNGLRKDDQSIKQLITWLGVYKTIDSELINKFKNCLNLHRLKDLKDFAEFEENLEFGKFKFKFTFFCPSLEPWNKRGFKYVHGDELITFAWECLNETTKPEKCSRRYDFTAWNELEFYVKFFKEKEDKPNLDEFNNYCKNCN